MSERRLPHGTIATTPVGIGCAYLTEGFTADQDRRIIDIAFETGARHFDVAPSYGMGTAEGVLGRALRGRRDQVTIATKVGQPRNEANRGKLLLRAIMAPTRGLRRNAGTPASSPQRQLDFSPAFVAGMLEDSLRRLCTDYVDAYLLHEVTPELVTPELLTLLADRKAAGQVRAIGLATSRAHADAIVSAWPGVFDIVQHSWNAFDPPLPPSPLFRITHRAIMGAMHRMTAWFRADPAAARRLADTTGCEVFDPRVLSALLLGAAMSANQGGITLVASRSVLRTKANVAAGLDPRNIEAGRRLVEAVVAEAAAR